jgi:DNA-binding transcriptional MerR regulator
MSGRGAAALAIAEADPDDAGDAEAGRGKPKKAPNAFRTISEVADELHIPQHVLRFWETKFPQVKPLKRGGGRRYYRPDDIALLRRVSDLLYTQGYTIKGVQRLLREGGGKLSDDIPPPPAGEREENAAGPEGMEAPAALAPELPMPGLLPAPAAVAPAGKRAARTRPEEPRAADSGADSAAEVVRLRTLLASTLRELEAMRALLS